MGWFGDPMNSGAGNRNREGKASKATPQQNAHWKAEEKARKRKDAKERRQEKRRNK